MEKQKEVMNKREVGADYESKACFYLEQKGYVILKRNYRTKTGEIDLIAKDGDCIVFIEVKYRVDAKYGYPREAVNRVKQRKIITTAKCFLKHTGSFNLCCRFDIVEILGEQVNHLLNAFMGG
jgi:putative endonuclease